MAKLRVGLLFGGCSGEHEVSIASAQAIAQALSELENSTKYALSLFYIDKQGIWHDDVIAAHILASGQPLALAEPVITEEAKRLALWQFPKSASTMDLWFPILHGPNGEDGTVQGFLTLLQVPFVGSGVLGSGLGMDKIAMKQAFAQAGLSQVEYAIATRAQIWSNPCVFPKLCDDIEQQVDGYPCFVKPANLGSSVGITKVRSRQELEQALDQVASYDRRVIIEAGVTAREVECAVLGNDDPQASVVGEITFDADFYDYETKYTAGLAQLCIPADLPPEVSTNIQELAIKAFLAVDAAGLGRVDFFYEEAHENILINEINTLPGFTATSMYPQLWAASDISFPQLVNRLIQLALERHHQ